MLNAFLSIGHRLSLNSSFYVDVDVNLAFSERKLHIN